METESRDRILAIPGLAEKDVVDWLEAHGIMSILEIGAIPWPEWTRIVNDLPDPRNWEDAAHFFVCKTPNKEASKEKIGGKTRGGNKNRSVVTLGYMPRVLRIPWTSCTGWRDRSWSGGRGRERESPVHGGHLQALAVSRTWMICPLDGRHKVALAVSRTWMT